MKHKEPQFVTEWRKMQPPKCCHTCLEYSNDGLCLMYKEIPPEQFAKTVNICDKWQLDIPF